MRLTFLCSPCSHLSLFDWWFVAVSTSFVPFHFQRTNAGSSFPQIFPTFCWACPSFRSCRGFSCASPHSTGTTEELLRPKWRSDYVVLCDDLRLSSSEFIAGGFSFHLGFLFLYRVARRRNAFFSNPTENVLQVLRPSGLSYEIFLRGQLHSILFEHKYRSPSHRLAWVPVPDSFSA